MKFARVIIATAVLAVASLPVLRADAQSTVRVSVSSTGLEGDRESCCPALSADGRYVAFGSFAHTLVPNDLNHKDDVFVRDMGTGVVTRVSVGAGGLEGNNSSFIGSISADGRFVAFESLASNLVPGDTNNVLDVFVRDRDPDGNGIFDEGNGVTERVNVSSSGVQANGISDAGSISADGRFVAFHSSASNLVPNDVNSRYDVFLRDRLTGTTTRVSVRSTGSEANADSLSPAVSADGRYVAFQSLASNLVSGDTNGVSDIFVHDNQSGATVRVSVDSARVQVSGQCAGSTISADGRYVAFSSLAGELVFGDTNGVMDAFVHDRDADGNGVFDEPGGVATTRVSVSSNGAQGGQASSRPSISRDGRFVSFASSASNLVTGDTNGRDDVFVRDRLDGTTTRVSIDSTGAQANDSSSRSAICVGGRFVAFESLASNLVSDDTNLRADIFVRDTEPCGVGNVAASSGPPVAVLMVNGGIGLVTTAPGSPVDLSLVPSPAGPVPARYVLWIWRKLPTFQTDLVVSGQAIGCTVNPTPLTPEAMPRPSRCIRGGLSADFCIGTREFAMSPATAPWTIHRARGYAVPAIFTVQGVIEDVAAANPLGLSVTNAVILKVQ